ncbi:Cytosolic Fe-S cluster assembling factor NBP35 [Olavius algarvensis associated proteobacterium Delta 3]|nr:Cytosolic Fe-S cluster assembling factor NBP35 [Olavius algarvensis associated proteobacterium Delta 3]
MTRNNVNDSAAGNTACGASGSSRMTSRLQDTMIENSLRKIRHTLIFMSGKGGVGKSSMSANIAVALAQRKLRVGLMDVDLHGPSLAGMMGVEGLLEITGDRFAIPKPFNQNLGVVSMQSLMPEPDQAVIWRGPAKTGVIRQFIADVQWGELDFLIVDAPPGTGDEPLSVAQTVPDAKAVIVTTPQDVALSDVRKSIGFCRVVHLEILGLVENMGPFPCPCCGKRIEIFKHGGGEITALQMGIPFLGTVPFDPQVVEASDSGIPAFGGAAFASFSEAITRCVDRILGGLSDA